MFNYDPSKHPTTKPAERSAIPKAPLWEDQVAPPQCAYGIGAPRTRTSQNCHALPQRGLDRKGKWLFAGHQHVRQQLCIRAGEKGEISSSPNSIAIVYEDHCWLLFFSWYIFQECTAVPRQYTLPFQRREITKAWRFLMLFVYLYLLSPLLSVIKRWYTERGGLFPFDSSMFPNVHNNKEKWKKNLPV